MIHIGYTNGFYHDNDKPLRILLFAESFPSFTSGITRRFKEIIRRLAKRKHSIHVITGCKVKKNNERDLFFYVFYLFLFRMLVYGLKEMIIYKNM